VQYFGLYNADGRILNISDSVVLLLGLSVEHAMELVEFGMKKTGMKKLTYKQAVSVDLFKEEIKYVVLDLPNKHCWEDFPNARAMVDATRALDQINPEVK
jgi:hypothetical protein